LRSTPTALMSWSGEIVGRQDHTHHMRVDT
jgi:hypothetical protein